MKKTVLSLVACALVLCVASAKAEYTQIEYDAYTGDLTAVDGLWEIKGFYGTGIAITEYTSDKFETAHWTHDQALEIANYDNDMTHPEHSYWSYMGPAKEWSITTSFEFSGVAEGAFELLFWNWGSTEKVTILLNGHELDYYWTGFGDEGKVIFDMKWMEDGVNELQYRVDTFEDQPGASGTNNIGVAFINESFAPTATPEPATLAIMGLGLAGAGFAARRRIK